jgi:hypothetical protein
LCVPPGPGAPTLTSYSRPALAEKGEEIGFASRHEAQASVAGQLGFKRI